MAGIETVNAAILLWFQTLRNPALNAFVWTFSQCVWLLFFLCLYLYWKGNKKLAAQLFLTFCLTLILANVLKALIQEPRPWKVVEGLTYVGNAPLGSAFPSAHTAAAFACFWTLHLDKKPWKGALTFAVLIALSRLYLGVHYPTDLLGGILIALAAAWMIDKGMKVWTSSNKMRN